MVRSKLILICQSRGEFSTSEDGTWCYSGGEAHAVDVTPETVYEDLKQKLAEMCELEHDSLSTKYFLPGNRRTLITMSNDRDLKRMYEFHHSSVTAEVFVQGKPALKSLISHVRADGITKAAAVMPISSVPASDPSSPTSPPASADRSGGVGDTNSSPTMDMESTPADTVKKRRRFASKKKDAKLPKPSSTKKQKITARRRKATTNRILDDDDDDDGDGSENDAEPESDGEVKALAYEVPSEQLVAKWKDEITGPGQEFKSVHEFREALQRYAIANRFMYRLKKNDTNRASGKCVAEACSWKLYASWDQSTQMFKIRSMTKAHTCDGESWKSAHPTKNWVVSVIKDKLLESPHHKPKEIAKSILRDFGVELNYTQVWRGITDARAQLQGSYKEAYEQLPWLREKFGEANPGSVIELIVSEEKRFSRLFVSFFALIHGFREGCRPVVFLDSVSLKSKYHEVLLTATSLDGDEALFPVAFSVADNENEESWRWFLEQLNLALSPSEPITFVFDFEKGLKAPVLEVFENAHVGYSIFHLSDNLKKNSKGPFYGDGKSSLRISLLAAAQSLRNDFFKMHTEQIKRVCSQAHEWLSRVGPEFWAAASFKGEPYNHVTSNVSELYSGWIEQIRESTVTQKIEALRAKTSELMEARRAVSGSWASRLTPSKEEKLREQRNKAHGLKVLFSSDTLFEVQGDSTHVVDIEKRSCTCLVWKHTGLPCSHAVSVFNCTGRDMYDFCSKHFTAEMYRTAYSESINPVPEPFKASESEGETVLPPFVTRPAPQPKKKETEANEERGPKDEAEEGQQEDGPAVPKKARRLVTCARCKGIGHNKATCKADL